MNTDQHELDHLIDLLVDDELDPSARRDLVARLDAVPGGWRRCALTYLEDQGWRAALGPATAELESGCCTPRPRRRAPLSLIGMAAGLFTAFLLGWSARGGAPPKGPAVVVAPVAPNPPRKDHDDAPRPTPQEQDRTGDGPLAVSKTGAPTADIARDDPESFLWRETLRRLQQHGYHVEPPQNRRMALELKNGRRLTVPVQEVRVHYTGNTTF
ncbi:MAG: hypothetical protein P4L84_37220 [Isosphaeraceae bacterium]|nr:hypothetical protein [Isosphaeraceae bacterium]